MALSPGRARAARHCQRSGELGPCWASPASACNGGLAHDDVDLAWILLPHDLSIALEILGYLPTPLHAVAEADGEGLVALSAWLAGPAWLQCEVGIRSPQHRRNIELRCRDGVAVLGDAYDQHIAVLRTDRGARGRAPPSWEARPFAPRMPLLAELETFVAYIGGAGPAPKSTAAEGLRVVEAIAELHRLAGVVGQH